MLIEEEGLRHWIDNFYGYGTWGARFWFIAYEEVGGDLPEDVADKLNYFHKAHPQPGESLCDIRELYRQVAVRADGPKANSFENQYEYRFGNNAAQLSYWKNLISFTHGYQGKELPDLLKYQQLTFASPSTQSEALINLYPLPSPHNHAWYYSWLDVPNLGFLKSRVLYQEHLYQRRMNTILTKVMKHKPDLVLMYGMNNINALKNSVHETFPEAKFKMVQAIKRLTPQHHRADLNGTVMLITTQIPALSHNRIETGFEWEEFGKRVKAEK